MYVHYVVDGDQLKGVYLFMDTPRNRDITDISRDHSLESIQARGGLEVDPQQKTIKEEWLVFLYFYKADVITRYDIKTDQTTFLFDDAQMVLKKLTCLITFNLEIDPRNYDVLSNGVEDEPNVVDIRVTCKTVEEAIKVRDSATKHYEDIRSQYLSWDSYLFYIKIDAVSEGYLVIINVEYVY